MNNDTHRWGFSCGHGSREAALRAAMNAYFRAGGIAKQDVNYSVGLATGADYYWQDSPGYYGIVGYGPGEQIESCAVEYRCSTPYVGWSFFGR
jgi:hypothetical protein